jgi:hypothetical protein
MPDVSEELTTKPPVDQRGTELAVASFVSFWVYAWVGIILAGATFGFFTAFGIGAIPGAVIAGVVSTPFTCTCAVPSWALWLTRFSVVFAAIAGACTGAISTVYVWGSLLILPAETAAFLAAIVGGLGGGGLACYYSIRYGWPNCPSDANARNIFWQFSLRDLFLRFTAVSVLIAVWTTLLAKLLR